MSKREATNSKFLRNCWWEEGSDGDTGEQQMVISLGTKLSVKALNRSNLIEDFINAALETKEMKQWLKNYKVLR